MMKKEDKIRDFYKRVQEWSESAVEARDANGLADSLHCASVLECMINACSLVSVEYNEKRIFFRVVDSFWGDIDHFFVTFERTEKTNDGKTLPVCSMYCSFCTLGGLAAETRELRPRVLQWRCHHMYFLLLNVLDHSGLAFSIFQFPCTFSVAQLSFRLYTDMQFDFVKEVETIDRAWREYQVNFVKDAQIVTHRQTEESLRDEQNCGICLDPCQVGCEWKCALDHDVAFHGTCIARWFQTHRNCPVCRKKYPSSTLLALKVSIFKEKKCAVFDKMFTAKPIRGGDGATREDSIDLT